MRTIVLILVMLFLSVHLNVYYSTYTEEKVSWDSMLVIGDGMFSIPWHHNLIGELKEEYKLQALHNSVGAWIDYREWMQYPEEWDVNIARFIRAIHGFGLPAGFQYGFHVGDNVYAGYDEPVGFLHYYRNLIV